MAKDFYVRTVQAGRYFKSVRYRRSLPSDSEKVRAAKTAATNKAQRFINLKNSAEKLQMLLCANFDERDACFCTFTFSEENLPANREMARKCLKSLLASLHRRWRQAGRTFKYVYNPEGISLTADPKALPAESQPWEIRPWCVKGRWDTVDQNPKKTQKRENVRLHLHCFLLLNKEDRELVRTLWPYGLVFINPIKVDDPESFYRLAYYCTKEARNGTIPSGGRSYVPSRNLTQPIIESHWCTEFEVLQPPAGAECVHTANESTEYASFQYCSYRLPRPKRQRKSYKSKGRL